MHTRLRTHIALLTVLAGLVAASLWPLDDTQPVADEATAAAQASSLSRSVAHAFPTAEAGFALRRRAVER